MNAESVEMAPSNGSDTTPQGRLRLRWQDTGALYDLAEPNCDGGTRVSLVVLQRPVTVSINPSRSAHRTASGASRACQCLMQALVDSTLPALRCLASAAASAAQAASRIARLARPPRGGLNKRIDRTLVCLSKCSWSSSRRLRRRKRYREIVIGLATHVAISPCGYHS